MLSANFGTGDSQKFNLSDPWWVKEVANSYAHVLLSDFFDSGSYTGAGPECALVTVARALKKVRHTPAAAPCAPVLPLTHRKKPY